jgi:hypothetical protein
MTLRNFKNPHTAARYAERRNSGLIAVRPASGRNQRRGCRSLGMAVTAICLLAGMLSLIPSFARAQDDGNIFSAILGSANQLGQEMNTLFQEEAKMQANLQQVVAPATQLLQIGMKLLNMYQTYWGLMNSLRSVAIQSASIPQTVTLENSMYGRLPMIPYLPSLSSPPSTALSPSAIRRTTSQSTDLASQSTQFRRLSPGRLTWRMRAQTRLWCWQANLTSTRQQSSTLLVNYRSRLPARLREQRTLSKQSPR